VNRRLAGRSYAGMMSPSRAPRPFWRRARIMALVVAAVYLGSACTRDRPAPQPTEAWQLNEGCPHQPSPSSPWPADEQAFFDRFNFFPERALEFRGTSAGGQLWALVTKLHKLTAQIWWATEGVGSLSVVAVDAGWPEARSFPPPARPEPVFCRIAPQWAVRAYLLSSLSMTASKMLAQARRRAGLTQRELARRAGTPQSAVARVETGAVIPRVDTLDKLLAACGEELQSRPMAGRGIDRTTIRQLLALSPGKRARLAATEANNLLSARRGESG
jgi:transcriptional regulator with XRE-family HTH domain